MLRITALALALLLSTGVLLPFVDSEAHGLRQNFLAKRQYHHRRHSRAWWRRHRARMARLRMKRRMQAEIRAAHRRALLRPEFSLPMASAAPVLPMDYVPVPVLPMATSAPVPVLPMANYAPVPVLPAAASAPVPVLPMATSAPVSIGEPVAVPLPISVSVPAPVTITESAPVPAYRPVKITATAAVTTPVIDPVDVPSAVLATIPAPTLTTVPVPAIVPAPVLRYVPAPSLTTAPPPAAPLASANSARASVPVTVVRPQLPAGWNTLATTKTGEVKFRTETAPGQLNGQASLDVVAQSRPNPVYMSAREERRLLAGVAIADLRRIVIDKMISDGGWVTNDYFRDISGMRVFIVTAQTPGDGRSSDKSWNFYFTEVNGRIYRLTTNTPPQFSDRMAGEAESFIASFHAISKPASK